MLINTLGEPIQASYNVGKYGWYLNAQYTARSKNNDTRSMFPLALPNIRDLRKYTKTISFDGLASFLN